MTHTPLPYFLGCPSWSENAWREGLYPQNARPADFLSLYAQVFNAVEGNTTFYARPAPTTVERWAQSLPERFRFTAKFPRDISHGGDLRQQLHAADDFLQLLRPLGARVAPFWLQLPASFGPQRLAELVSFIDTLQRPLAVEVRHPDFFAKGEAERALNRLLMDKGINRIMLDSRPLFSVPASLAAKNAALVDAQGKKPRLPVHLLATANSPVVRLIGLPHPEDNHPFLPSWLPHWKQWLAEGKDLYLFIHTADNARAPELARQVSRLLGQEMAPWPGENDRARQGLLPF